MIDDEVNQYYPIHVSILFFFLSTDKDKGKQPQGSKRFRGNGTWHYFYLNICDHCEAVNLTINIVFVNLCDGEVVIITIRLLNYQTSQQEEAHVSIFNLEIFYQPSPTQTVSSNLMPWSGPHLN